MSETFATGAPAPEAPSPSDLGANDPAPSPDNSQSSGNDAPEPAQSGDDQGVEAPQTPQKQRFVPHEALHEARQETRREREERVKLEARFEEFRNVVLRGQQGQQGQQQAAPALPDRETDPVGYFQAKTEALERQLAQVQAPQQASQARQAFVANYQKQANEFAASNPDFSAAYQHALKAMAADAPFAGLASATDMEEFIAQQAMRVGRNPGQVIYDYAKARGYGVDAAPKAAPDTATIARGQQASRTAGGGGQPAGNGETSLERVAKMPLKELRTLSDEQWKKALGG